MLLRSLIGCSLLHEVLCRLPLARWIGPVPHRSNRLTCILFQLYFLWRAGYLLYAQHRGVEQGQIPQATMDNLHALGGYFVYDLCYLIQTGPWAQAGFIFHHLIGLGMIRLLDQQGLPPPSLVTHYLSLSFVAEVTNPFLNLRYLTRGTRWEQWNRQAIFWTYTVFRMAMYPWLSYRLHAHLQNGPLFALFMVIYGMSMVWYRKVWHMTWGRS